MIGYKLPKLYQAVMVSLTAAAKDIFYQQFNKRPRTRFKSAKGAIALFSFHMLSLVNTSVRSQAIFMVKSMSVTSTVVLLLVTLRLVLGAR